MNKIIIQSLFLILILSCTAVDKSQNDLSKKTGIVYGDDFKYLYMVTAPNGWILDNKAGVKQGLNAVFYPEGSSWDTSIVVMYTNFETINQTPTEKAIEENNERFKIESPNVIIEDLGDLEIDSLGKKANIRSFSGDQFKNYEHVGYIRDDKYLTMFVLSSRNKSSYDKSINSFYDLVKSYKRIKVTVQYK